MKEILYILEGMPVCFAHKDLDILFFSEKFGLELLGEYRQKTTLGIGVAT
jgi:hypothetical protein